jgi:hypothetical protein
MVPTAVVLDDPPSLEAPYVSKLLASILALPSTIGVVACTVAAVAVPTTMVERM